MNEAQDIIKDAHEQWLGHPTTSLLLANLRKHKESFIHNGVINVTDQGTNDNYFRLLFSNIKNTDAIIKLITDYETFNKLTMQR